VSFSLSKSLPETVYAPAARGPVVVITPVVVLTERPAGAETIVSKVTGAVPPVVASVSVKLALEVVEVVFDVGAIWVIVPPPTVREYIHEPLVSP
jgi:hypothetical protein